MDNHNPIPIASSSHGKRSGKPWKLQKTPTARSHMQPALKSKSFSDRMEKASKALAIKKLQAELKEEKEAEIQRRREVTLERRKAAEERKRAEELKAQLGLKKAARLRRRAGRTKKMVH
jgi:rRNA-processing protein CGR1